MLEAPINRRPDYVIRVWQLCVSVDTYIVVGRDYIDGQLLTSGVIKFVDAEQQLLLDDAGVVWLAPAGEHDDKGGPPTERLARMIEQRRERRDIPALTTEQLEYLHKLLSKRV